MLLRTRFLIVVTLCACAGVSFIATPAWADLQKYLSKPEAAFEWQLKNKIDSEKSGDRIYNLQFVSQIWQDNKWQHQLQVYLPVGVAPNSTMFLWVTGGSARAEYILLGMELARNEGAGCISLPYSKSAVARQ